MVLVLLWVYAVYRLGTLWHSSKDYAYGWFVPLLCLCFVLGALASIGPRRNLWKLQRGR